ncbi:MAG TPA: M4 family metallopeptidase [Dongiaceae bacterium]|nr:M4 family metallopeptidase [Dongiaceae bacterium]
MHAAPRRRPRPSWFRPVALGAALLGVLAGAATLNAAGLAGGGARPAPPRPEPARAQAILDLRADAAGPVTLRMSPDGARLDSARGALTGPTLEAPQQAAESFLARHAGVWGARPDLADLVLDLSRVSPAGTHFRYRQTFEGLPVFDAGVDLHLSGEGAVYLLHNRFEPGLALDTTPRITPIGAALRARIAFARAWQGEQGIGIALPAATVAASGLGIATRAGQAIEAAPDVAPRLAWRIVLQTADPAGAREFLIDANDGALLRARDLEATSHETGRGRVFDPNPVSTLGDPTLRDNDDADGPEFAPAYREVELPNLTRLIADRFDKIALRGPFARVTDFIESPFMLNPMSSTGDFLFGRDADGFEAVMAYYHVDRTQRYIQSLGFADLDNRDIRVDPHGLKGAKNAHYLGFPPGMGHIAFGAGGTGGVDLAEDADVIWHEYGHSMQDNQNPGAYLSLGETGAQGEGFGDYWAFINTVVTSPNVADPACIGEWAWEGECLRRTDGTKHYPEDIEREVHADGEIWSAFLTQIAVALGPETANRIILESHFLAPMFPKFDDGARALLDADQALYGGAHAATIAGLATARGIDVGP